jgi:restriction endonuclease S subunit
MIKKPIVDLADVMVGLVLKRKEADPTTPYIYHYKALTLKSLNSEGWIDKDLLDEFKSNEDLDKRYLCLEGDVIIKITPPYTAVAINKDIHGSVVPAQFIIIRVNNKSLVPEYLAFYLNAGEVRKEIILSATGNIIPMLKTGTIRELEIPILDLEKQLKIGEVSKLIVKERRLMSKLAETKDKYYQALTKSLIKEEM